MDSRARMRHTSATLAALALLVSASGALSAEPDQALLWFKPSHQYYNSVARLPWSNAGGDWQDSRGAKQGDLPFAQSSGIDSGSHLEFDVTRLVGQWIDGVLDNQGFLLRGLPGSAPAVFGSRESGDATAPRLILRFGSETKELLPLADASLDKSTSRSLSHLAVRRVH